MRMLQAEIPRRKFHRIFVTHLHGDHIFGLGGLISSLNLGQREYPLHIHGPRGIRRFVEFMVGFPRPTRMGFELLYHELAPGFSGEVCETTEYTVLARPLDHTIPAFGYRFQEQDRPGRFDEERATELGIPFGPERGRLIRGEPVTLADGRVVQPGEIVGPARPGRSLAYVTDTGFCANARLLALNVDLLVHEATFADELVEMAFARKHSTIRHAATIARHANARQLVATHFSTRYDGPAIRTLEQEGREVYPGIRLAKDLMRVPVRPAAED
jgi:ribonuclease Z